MENSPPKMRPRCDDKLQSADPSARRRGSSWLHATICRPSWQVCGDQQIADQVQWRAQAWRMKMKIRGLWLVRVRLRFLGIVTNTQSQMHYFVLFGLIMRHQNNVVLVVQFFFMCTLPVRVCKTGRVIGFPQNWSGLAESSQATCMNRPIVKPTWLDHWIPVGPVWLARPNQFS